MKVKEELLTLLGSAIILSSAGKLSAQTTPQDTNNYSNPKEKLEQILNINDNFTINYEVEPPKILFVPIFWGGGNATWENRECDKIPSEKNKTKVSRVLNAKVKASVAPFINLNIQYRSYVDSLGKPIESMFADFKNEGNITPLERAVMKEEFPTRWRDIKRFSVDWFDYRKGIVIDGKGRKYKIDSSFTDMQTTYFKIENIVKKIVEGYLKAPLDTTLNVLADTTKYAAVINFKRDKENNKYIDAKVNLKNLVNGKPSSTSTGISGLKIKINKKYFPNNVKAKFLNNWGSVEVKTKNYRIRNNP